MSDTYTVLARRFRPQTFDDVVGQEHVAQALKNAIASDRIAHAYLFTGARGVGKTSSARIFAKALNCPNAQDGVPCNSCEACDAIGAGNDVDVLEIDGASNRGIDDVRQLRANVGIKPMRSPRKVYIVDEVHMLTKEAFNALLKTLEEPPPNVNFIFCTTEPQKVPDTILSRCQRFDFGTIETGRITDRLKEIAAAEGREVEDDAVAMIARRAAGSMRDSQSLFDQLLAFGGQEISAEDVHRLFGTAPDERLVELAGRIMEGDRAGVLTMVDEALNNGVRLDSLADQLVAYVRDLMVLAAGAAEATLTAVGEGHRAGLAEQASRWGLRTVTAALQVLSDTKLKMARTVHGRPLLELALVRMTLLGDLDQLADLVATLRQNPSALSGLAAAAPASKKNARVIGREPSSSSEGRTSGPGQPSEHPAPAVGQAPPGAGVSRPSIARPPSGQAEPDLQTTPAIEPSAPGADAPGSPVDTSVSSTVPLTPDSLAGFWPAFLKAVPENTAKRLGQCLRQECREAGQLRLIVPASNEFLKTSLERPQTAKLLADTAKRVSGSPVVVSVIAEGDAAAPPPPTVAAKQQDSTRKKNSVVDDDAFVQKAIEVFDAKLLEVRTVPTLVAAASVGQSSAGDEFDEDTAYVDDLTDGDDDV